MRSEVYIQCSNHRPGGDGDQSFMSDIHLKQRALCSLARSLCSRSGLADLLVYLRQPDRQVSSTSSIWLPSSPPLSFPSPCQRGLLAVAPRSGVVWRRVWVRSMRGQPLRDLPSAPLSRTTRLSQNSPPTVNTRSRRTQGKRRRKALWAARWMDECLPQRIVEFVLVRQYTASRWVIAYQKLKHGHVTVVAAVL